MFVDHVTINVKAGNGGNGMVAFRREKYEPNGGPAGGDGGRGGSVVFRVSTGLRTLMDFRYNQKFKADHGQNGGIKGMTGRGAEDRVILVPQGTTVIDDETDMVIADLIEVGDQVVVAQGGRGGRGNVHFATPKNPAPELAENGAPGEERRVRLELKLLADVGLIGFPSVGKSTLLAAITSAKPKIGEYHFTTLTPNLGMVKLSDGRDFAVADLPGLIEGAADGVGLGIEFLKHIERTRVLLHLIDVSGFEDRDPYDDFLKINAELKKYDPDLLKRPQIVVATKMDLPDSAANLATLKQKLAKDTTLATPPVVMAISSVTHEGLTPLIQKTVEILDQTPAFPVKGVDDLQKMLLTDDQPAEADDFEINRDGDGTWVLTGAKLERLFQMTNMDHEESTLRFARQLRGMGVDDALRAKGAHNGDLVQIDDFTFEFVE
ncbi:GTPase Obg [Secundilactobacillus pentosiphilus]|uniref:GTPase Obg n=1 Tax=Secundilactobacillus pentosiphilus TaxID=1714682 RepID=A0A1Z5IP58_9LACO|nr:GTPase ObgE [Secundilactobacillus pentosiphilus]GAX03535.1 GTPase Obg [Secundilactobacillus pentosiphilus]GAX05629.1 GTPase Obg [Secundilactobacillus pentosiphilus]